MSSARSLAELRGALEDVVQRGALALDERRYADWLDLAAPELRYRIAAYSPELRKDMIWLDHDRPGMVALIELLPKHHSGSGDWLRQVVLGAVEADSPSSARAVSSIAVFETAVDVGDSHVDGGSSSLFVVGRYHDRFRLDGERWLLSERTVRLHTRQLGIGSHRFV
ncbi:MAG TPA: nuclear transport factor 2 family protein [Polyangiaceae bacterium]|nr:nuclear transport factor 2 family protein [Polyangiaceae bacterium]